MRGFLSTLAVACSLVGAVAGAAWAVEVVTLPQPANNDRIVATAVAWFFRFGLVESDFEIGGGRPVDSACVQGRLPVLPGKELEQATVLAFGGGALLDAQPGLRVIGLGGGEPETLPLVQFELGGCSLFLGQLLGALPQHRPFRIRRAVVAGHQALVVGLRTSRTRITVYLTPKTFRPFAVRVASHRFSGHARIRFLRLTPNRLHAILLRAGL